VRFFRRRSLL